MGQLQLDIDSEVCLGLGFGPKFRSQSEARLSGPGEPGPQNLAKGPHQVFTAPVRYFGPGVRVHEDQQSEFGDHRKCKGKVLFTHTEKNFFSSRTKDSISLRRADIDQKTQTQICSFPKILNTIRDTIHLSLYDPATGLPAERRMVGYSLHSSSWLFLV